MSFQFSRNPQHVKHPQLGWLDFAALEATSRRPEIARLIIELGPHFKGGRFDPAKKYDVEVDCSTGLEAWQEQ